MVVPASTQSTHLLRLVVSCRKITVQVTSTSSNSIIAMASSTEQEFIKDYKAKLNRVPRSMIFWNSKTASQVGDKIGIRLGEIGVSTVGIDVQEELSRPIYFRKLVSPFFEFYKAGGYHCHRCRRIGVSQMRTIRLLREDAVPANGK